MFAKEREDTSFVDHCEEGQIGGYVMGFIMRSIEHSHSSWVEAVEGERRSD